MYRIQMIFIEHSIERENTHSFQLPMGHIPKQTISWTIKQTSTNVKNS